MVKSGKYFVCVVGWAFILLYSDFSFPQTNLVLNGSFEDTICCPSTGQRIYCTPPWFDPTLGTADYYHVCAAPGGAGVPNAVGYQYPYTGQGFVGIYTYQAGSNGREYVEYPIPLSPLIQNKKYCVGFYVNLPNGGCSIDGFHAYLSTDSITDYTGMLNFPYVPHISNPTGNIIDDTLNWTLVSGYYIAQGGEKFITLGNFYPDSMTNLGAGWNPATSASYYYIDNVFIYDCDNEGVNEMANNELQMTIYPNPVSDDFTIETELKQAGEVTITITDYLGRKVEELNEKANAGTCRKKIITQPFAKGEYTVTIKTKEGTGVRKIIIK